MLLLLVYLHIIFFLYKKITFSHFCEKEVSGNKEKTRKSDENKGRCVRVHSFPAHALGEAYTFSSQSAPRRKREAHQSGFECQKKKFLLPSFTIKCKRETSAQKPVRSGGPEELTPLHSGPGPREGPPQKLLNSSYFFIQSICGAFFFSLAWIFIFSSAAVALRPISAKGSIIRLPSSSAS